MKIFPDSTVLFYIFNQKFLWKDTDVLEACEHMCVWETERKVIWNNQYLGLLHVILFYFILILIHNHEFILCSTNRQQPEAWLALFLCLFCWLISTVHSISNSHVVSSKKPTGRLPSIIHHALLGGAEMKGQIQGRKWEVALRCFSMAHLSPTLKQKPYSPGEEESYHSGPIS